MLHSFIYMLHILANVEFVLVELFNAYSKFVNTVYAQYIHTSYYKNRPSVVFQTYPQSWTRFHVLLFNLHQIVFHIIDVLRLCFPAPYTPIKKSVRKTGQDEVELSCESQGFPSPQVFWSDGQNTNLTETSKSSTLHTDEDVVKVFSTLTVRRDLVNNYTCSFLRSGEVQQTASFSIPGGFTTIRPDKKILHWEILCKCYYYCCYYWYTSDFVYWFCLF